MPKKRALPEWMRRDELPDDTSPPKKESKPSPNHSKEEANHSKITVTKSNRTKTEKEIIYIMNDDDLVETANKILKASKQK